MYLYRDMGKVAAHIWDGKDTACRMWTTGGMRQEKGYTVSDEPGERRICLMCKNNTEARLENPY